MDFNQLMKQAATNQSVTLKKFDKLKQKEKAEETYVKEKKVKVKEKANEKLKRYETDLIKSRLTYKGLLSSKGEPLTSKAKQQLDQAAKPNHVTIKTPSISPKSSLTFPKSTTSSKSKSTSPSCPTATHKLTKNSQKLSKSQTPPPRLKDSKKSSSGPVNFQDLLKLAHKNNASSLSSCQEKREEEKSKHVPGSGIGKSLLDRSKREERLLDKPKRDDKKPLVSDKRTNNGPVKSTATSVDKPPSINGKVYPYGTPQRTTGQSSTRGSRGQPTTGESRGQPTTGESRGQSTTGGSRGQPIRGGSRGQPIRGGSRGQPIRGVSRGQPTTGGSGTATEGTRSQHVAGRGNANSGRGFHTMKTKSFYGGTPSSARLITDGPSRSSQNQGPMCYKSAWVDEMRDYLQNNNLDLEDEEYEDDLDDFVVDDNSYQEAGEDYSSAIQEIFGTRYRTRVEEEDDDRLMESSYAQQQFEEYRSSRIGEMEDAEDIRREQEMLRKRKPVTNASSFASGHVTKKIKR